VLIEKGSEFGRAYPLRRRHRSDRARFNELIPDWKEKGPAPGHHAGDRKTGFSC